MKAKTEAVMAYLLLAAALVTISAVTGGAWSLAALAASCAAGGRAGALIGVPSYPPPERGYMGLPGPMGPKGDPGPPGPRGRAGTLSGSEWDKITDRTRQIVEARIAEERGDDD